MKAHRAISIQDLKDEIQFALDRGDTPKAMKLGRALKALQKAPTDVVGRNGPRSNEAWAQQAQNYTHSIRG